MGRRGAQFILGFLRGVLGRRRGEGFESPFSGSESTGLREVLPAAEFAVFARLRQWRKETAKEEAVPVYMVFTNEQLAQMASRRASSRAELEQIAGVGNAQDREIRIASAGFSRDAGRRWMRRAGNLLPRITERRIFDSPSGKPRRAIAMRGQCDALPRTSRTTSGTWPTHCGVRRLFGARRRSSRFATPRSGRSPPHASANVWRITPL